MSILSRLTNIASWQPLSVGDSAPELSLTADEGTWIKLPDFKGHINVILLFFGSLNDNETDDWLKAFQNARGQFEDLETVVFGITTHRTDRLRDFRNTLGLEYYLLYDPLAIESRAFRASGRVRPVCKPHVVVVDKQGEIALAEKGFTDVATIMNLIARLEGTEVQPTNGVQPAAGADQGEFSGVRNPGEAAAVVTNIDSEKAEALLANKDANYVLIDVRTGSEYDADHSPQAVHIPVDELPHRYQELGQTTHLITVCQAGGRSAAAAEFLTSIGCSEVYNVLGGMSEWSGERVTGGERA